MSAICSQTVQGKTPWYCTCSCSVSVRWLRAVAAAPGLACHRSSPNSGNFGSLLPPPGWAISGRSSIVPELTSLTQRLRAEPRRHQRGQRDRRCEDNYTHSTFTLNIPIGNLWSSWKFSKVPFTTLKVWPASKSVFLQKYLFKKCSKVFTLFAWLSCHYENISIYHFSLPVNSTCALKLL